MVKNPPANAGDIRDVGLIPDSGRSPGGGNSYPLQYSCLKYPWTEELGGLQFMVCKESDTTDRLLQYSTIFKNLQEMKTL